MQEPPTERALFLQLFLCLIESTFDPAHHIQAIFPISRQTSTMSHPQEPQRQPTRAENVDYAKTLRNTALVTAVACPLLMLLPPRKLDFFTAGLGITTVYSTNFLVRDYTGRSIQQHITGYRPPIVSRESLQTVEAHAHASDAIRLERQEALKASKERASIAEQVEATKQAKWAEERNKEVQDALDIGKGFGDIIIDQVYEVWNWGKKRDDDDE
jgi:hypothetical protein